MRKPARLELSAIARGRHSDRPPEHPGKVALVLEAGEDRNIEDGARPISHSSGDGGVNFLSGFEQCGHGK